MQCMVQVVLAVDDSRSMQENGCSVFALEAVTLLARALTRLEVGQLGILRFGGTDHVRPLHSLAQPFSDADGLQILSQLRFNQACAAPALFFATTSEVYGTCRLGCTFSAQ
jgi:midasin